MGYLVVQYQEKQKTQEVQRKIEEQNYQKQTLENFLEEWAVNEEPIHNKDQGYPIDWKVRRQAVLLRDNFACSVCQKILGYRFVYSYDWKEAFYDDSDQTIHNNRAGYLCYDAHVHHIKRIKDGGGHELINLQLLCTDCHTKQPGHKALYKTVKIEQYQKSYRGNNKLKRAKIEHTCDICEKIIDPGQEYFGGYYKKKNSGRFGIKLQSKICLDCYKKHENRYKYHVKLVLE